MKKTKERQASRKIGYPVGDFLIRLKNAVIAGNKEVVVPSTKLIKAVADVLKKKGYLEEVKLEDRNLQIKLAIRRKLPILMDVKLVSKPGLRIYMKVDELAKVKGPSIMILSTPLGILTGTEAIKKATGGEVIAKIL